MSIAYLVSDYGAASHTFIRREVAALRAMNWQIATFSVQACPGQGGTESILGRPASEYVVALLWAFFRSPRRFLTCWKLAVRHRVGGLRPLLWSQFHFVEALLLARLIDRRGISHLHSHFANSGATVGMLAAHFAKINWSLTLHGISETDYPAGATLAEKVKRATFVACASYFIRAQAMRLVDDKQWLKMHIVRCGIDFSLLPAATKGIPDFGGGAVRFICVGRLSPEKGYAGLLVALARLAEKGLEFTLTIVGGGPLSQQVHAASAELGIRDRIRFTGPLPERATLAEIADADMLILPSLMEGLPVVLIEALALGKPVLASRVAGIPELISEDISGWLFSPSNWSELEVRLQTALAARAKWSRMGRAGRERVESEFHVERSGADMARLFANAALAGELNNPDLDESMDVDRYSSNT